MKQTPRILMVEDSASLAAVYRAYLQEGAYQLVTVESLGGLRPAFDKRYGTITAGNSSPRTST